MSGWTMNAWSRFARQKVERVFAPISPLTAPFGRCRATRMKRRVCTSAPQQQQQRQARPAVAAALSAIWEQGILPALHSLLQHGSDTSRPRGCARHEDAEREQGSPAEAHLRAPDDSFLLVLA